MALAIRRLLASLLIAALLAVGGLRGQTLSLGGDHAHGPDSAHADHGHHHDHHHEPSPAAPHSHDDHDTHLHLSIADWARMAARAAVDMPKLHVLVTLRFPAIPDVGAASCLSRPMRNSEPWRSPPRGELAALCAIRLLV